MKRKTKSIGLCLLLVLALLFCSCQTSAVKEEQASADPTVTAAAKDSAEDGNTKDSSEVKEDNSDKEPEYIDEEYVDEHYGSDEEKEDLSKYKKKSSSSKKSDSKNSDTEEADGTESNGTTGMEALLPVRKPVRTTTIPIRSRRENRIRWNRRIRPWTAANS